MIFDRLENLERHPLPFIKEIRQYLNSLSSFPSSQALAPMGKYGFSGNLKFPSEPEIEILGRDLFVRTGDYETGKAAEKQFEAHTVYADLQLMIEGSEVMDISLEKNPEPVTAYNPEADIRFFKDPREVSSVQVPAGHFTVFFPGELHKPGCDVSGKKQKVKKLVFKIKWDKRK